MLYGADARLTSGDAIADDDPLSAGMRMAFGGGGGEDAREEPTEVAPDGLPTGGYLQATVMAESIVRPLGPDGPSPLVLGTDALAMTRTHGGEPVRRPGRGRPQAAGARTARHPESLADSRLRRSGDLRLRRPRRRRPPRRTPPSSISPTFPRRSRTRVAKRMDRLRKSPLGTILSMGPGAFGGPKAKP